MADLSKLLDTKQAAEDGITFNLTTFDGSEELDITVSVVGAGSAAWKQAEKVYNAAYDKLVKSVKGDVSKIEDEELEKLMARKAAACVKGWANVEVGDKAVPFSKEAAEELFIAYPNFGVQVITKITDIDAMLKKRNSSFKTSAK